MVKSSRWLCNASGPLDIPLIKFRFLKFYCKAMPSKNSFYSIAIGIFEPKHFRDRSLFMTRGAQRKTIFYWKIFCGPLSAWTKNFAAHLTSHDNFLTPTLEEYNGFIFIGKGQLLCQNNRFAFSRFFLML